MGKPFSNELSRLSATFAWAEDANVDEFRDFVAHAHGHLLVIIGAGGSFTVAEFARLLHEIRGNTAVAHTPLSFLQSESDLRQAYVLIFTSSGGNRDVLATYKAAIAREPLGILVACGRKNSKVERLADGEERTCIFSRAFPAGKDGYLATNSLVAFMRLAMRAFREPAELAAPLPLAASFSDDLLARNTPDYYLALFGGWARPAACDLESKFSEAGLGGVMLADYRNFAHGRHNWIHKRGARSAVIAFISPDSAVVAEKTLALLPASVRIIRLETNAEGPSGALDLLVQVFHLTAVVGRTVGIDPGRPGVPGYGRRIYHLGPVFSLRGTDALEASVARKLSARHTSGNSYDREIVAAARARYVAALIEQPFGALVADFDGTVVSPGANRAAKLIPAVMGLFEELLRARVPIYFATGRGDSIQPVLRRSFAKRFHSLVFVSYYNGSVTRCLTDEPPAEEGGPHHAEFDALIAKLDRAPFFTRARPANKSYQLTLKIQDHADFPLAAARIREVVLESFPERFRVVESSHSLDVIPRETSKLSCVSFAQSRLDGKRLLTIGDRGALTGNDFDLLTHPFSLSVDQVSASLTSCWNLLPAGVRNVAGLLHLGRGLRVGRGAFRLKVG